MLSTVAILQIRFVRINMASTAILVIKLRFIIKLLQKGKSSTPYKTSVYKCAV